MFWLGAHSSFARKLKVVVVVFVSKLDHRPLFNGIYYETSTVRIGFNVIYKCHTLPIHHVS